MNKNSILSFFFGVVLTVIVMLLFVNKKEAEWIPQGTVTSNDVIEGKTFYNRSRDIQTGTYTPPTPIDFSNMQYSTWDNMAGEDFGGFSVIPIEDYQGEESEWSDMSVGEEMVWKDERTGLYWSSYQINDSNIFTMSSCDFFTSTPRSSYNGLDTDCGNAINWCAKLEFGGRSNWYLPSQTELMQAYIDGMYNQAGDTLAEAATFAQDNFYWSSSEVSYSSTYAWGVDLYDGNTGFDDKTYTYFGLRCVSRD